ncbi:MAG: hypothetical protein JXA53_00785 [Bacteroidales bacterium]|nr:hypothetical protein [Bacteroidales bacterium]
MRIILKISLVGFILIIILVIIASTTRFQITRNDTMEYFYSQHIKIDSTNIDKKIPKEQIFEDIDFLVKSIEEIHPNPYFHISKTRFYSYRDSIKQLIKHEITRDHLFQLLEPFVRLMEDNHTHIHFPEKSKGIDNKESLDKILENSKNTIEYKNYDQQIGYLKIRYFAIGRNEFAMLTDSVFNQIKKDSVINLIIDIRNNPGGDSYLADYLISNIYDKPYKGSFKIQIKRSEQNGIYMEGVFSWWFRPFVKSIKNFRDYYNTPIGGIYNDIKGIKNPMNVAHRYKGNVYLLINYYTGSTALGLATIFKDYDIGEIIGEETRSEVNEFGDVFPFDLPNSKLWVWCSTKRYIRPSGEMTVGGLKPDIYYKDQNDSIINYTINMIKNK